ncbi:MAG: addiction module protein [bacterium]
MTKFESVLTQALELDEDERQLLAMRLEMSLDETKDPGYDAHWSAEIKTRVAELDRGEADEMDWDDAMKFIFDD